MASDRVKKSMIASALVGTGGFFVAKMIGLLYSIPFSTILSSDELMSYYGSAYNLYAYFLNVFTAGVPFAIATLVAKYSVLENYKAVRKIQRLSVALMTGIGAFGALIMILLSWFLASLMASGQEGVHIMQICLVLLAIAVFLVPILSGYRGFVQGEKEMGEYAFSQAYEQVFRVGFLLTFSCILVYVFGMERRWALYVAVTSTSVAALAALLQVYTYSKRLDKKIRKKAKRQQIRSVSSKFLMRRLIQLSIPYFIAAIVGYSDSIYNAVLLPIGLKLSGYTVDEQNIMVAAVNYVGVKLTAIPMVLAPGFTAAIIPHLSESLTQHNYRKIRRDVKESLNIILFIVAFLSFGIFAYAAPLFYCLFYTTDLALSASVIRWIALEGFFNSIAPVITSMMMALNLQKPVLKRMAIMAVLKGVIMVPLVMWFGVAGAVISTAIAYGYLIVGNLGEIAKKFRFNYHLTFIISIKIVIGLIFMGLCAWGLSYLGLASTESGKLICFFTSLVSGTLSSAVFFIVEFLLGVPQQLFHFGRRQKRTVSEAGS